MADNVIDINKKTLVDTVCEDAAMLVSDKGRLVRFPLASVLGNNEKVNFLGALPYLPDDASQNDIIQLSETIYRDDIVIIPRVDAYYDSYGLDDDIGMVIIPLYSSNGIDLILPKALKASFNAYGKGGKLTIVYYDSEDDNKIETEEEWVDLGEDDENLYVYLKNTAEPFRGLDNATEYGYIEVKIPNDHIGGILEEYKPVLYSKGDCLLFDGSSWRNLSGDEGRRLSLALLEHGLKLADMAECILRTNQSIGIYDIGNGNASSPHSETGCKGYYIDNVDSKNKKIYLSDKQHYVYDSVADVTDTEFPTPTYDIGDVFSIKGDNYAYNVGRITAIQYNVISYELVGSFPEKWKEEDLEVWDNTLYVLAKPDVGDVDVIFYAAALGEGNEVRASRSFAAGAYNTLQGYMDIVLGGFNNVYGNSNVAFGHGLYLVKDHQHARGWYNVSDPKGQFADVFGVGTETENDDGTKTIKRSNAYSLDWNGNMRFKGKVYECCEDGTGDGHELARASLLGFNSPCVARYSEDGDLYAEARDSLSYEFNTDVNGLVYTHMIPQNTQSFMGLICYSLPLVPLSQGKVWVKFLMRTNQTVNPNVVIYNVKDKDGKALNSPQKAGSITGDGQWHEVLIEFDNLPEDAYTTNYIQIQFAGRLIRGSAYYNVDGTLKDDAYFDIASWGIFTDKVSAESFDMATKEHTGSLVKYVDKKTDNTMNHIGVVDALPTSANENDVYVLKGAISTTVSFEGAVHLESVSSTMLCVTGGYDAHIWLEGIVSDIGFHDGSDFYISVNGKSYVLKNAHMELYYNDGEYEARLHYSQNDEIVQALDGVDSFVASANPPDGTYIYHNGEWVELTKDGVTKSEMESYIEETILGGEW